MINDQEKNILGFDLESSEQFRSEVEKIKVRISDCNESLKHFKFHIPENQELVYITGTPEELKTIKIIDFTFAGCKGVVIMDSTDICKITKDLTEASVLVTYGNWYESDLASKCVEIARIIQLPITHSSKFGSYVKQRNDR